jgi:hypothetical protein
MPHIIVALDWVYDMSVSRILRGGTLKQQTKARKSRKGIMNGQVKDTEIQGKPSVFFQSLILQRCGIEKKDWIPIMALYNNGTEIFVTIGKSPNSTFDFDTEWIWVYDRCNKASVSVTSQIEVGKVEIKMELVGFAFPRCTCVVKLSGMGLGTNLVGYRH